MRGWGGKGAGAAIAVAFAILCPAPASAAAATPYLAGAARVDTTPPAFDATADAIAFPTCSAAIFTGPRAFALSEPYVDADGDGEFSYTGVGQNAVPEPYCDANMNDRYDGIYDSGGVDQLARSVHDPIDARAFAISDGQRSVVVVSVVAQGLFENYTAAMRARLAQLAPGVDDLVVSANHNESSPDTVGIYGGPEVGGVTGANSGIDDYYIDFLVERVAQAAAQAYDDRVPAQLAVSQFGIPSNLEINLSNNFPTTNDDKSPAAIDPKVRVLTATDAAGGRIFTTMNLAAHNQEIGHSVALGRDLSSDWPGYFHDELERLVGGRAIFLVGDNGSEEDPITLPPVDETAHPECSEGCYPQARATGEAFAHAVADHLSDAQTLRGGAIGVRRDQFFVPLENNLFKAAAAAGLFGDRETYLNGVPAGRAGDQLQTEADVVSIGPDLQLMTNPGEAFPALMLGSPWGIEDAGCPERPNPPVPAWHMSATYRFQVGLANDLIGYEIPAWAYSSSPGAFTYRGPPDNGGPASCVNDADDVDPAGHQHKLETEGAGPTASNMVAEHLAALADLDPDPVAAIRRGRFLYADGTTSRRARRSLASSSSEAAVGVWLADPGSASLTPGAGTILALSGIDAFGDQRVDEAGQFIDYDGQTQPGPDISTRGMLTPADGSPVVSGRYYLDVYPALSAAPLGSARAFDDSPISANEEPENPGGAGPEGPVLCADHRPPASLISTPRFGIRRLRIRGSATDSACNDPGTVPRAGSVTVMRLDVARRVHRHRCLFLRPSGHLQARSHPCSKPIELIPAGLERWRLVLRVHHLPRGRYLIRSRAADGAGNREPLRSTTNGSNAVTTRLNNGF